MFCPKFSQDVVEYSPHSSITYQKKYYTEPLVIKPEARFPGTVSVIGELIDPVKTGNASIIGMTLTQEQNQTWFFHCAMEQKSISSAQEGAAFLKITGMVTAGFYFFYVVNTQTQQIFSISMKGRPGIRKLQAILDATKGDLLIAPLGLHPRFFRTPSGVIPAKDINLLTLQDTLPWQGLIA